jgi:UDP-N-acetylmuramate dehydrogenase
MNETRQIALGPNKRRLLEEVLGDTVAFDVPMARNTTLRIGGPADAIASPKSIEELRRVLVVCAERAIPVTPVGGGSNLLVKDGGVRGVVLSTRRMRGLERRGDTAVFVEAGVSTGKLLSTVTRWELGGLEFLGGVPGSVGGGLIMNAGTYLGEFVDVTREVTSVRLADGELVTRDNAACGFSYRHSELPRDEVVAAAICDLKPRPRAEIDADVRALRDNRHAREPARVSNSGSTFKNPAGDFAGRLIEAAGLKGTRVGGAECSPVHANWLVNTGGATAADMLALIDLVRGRVREQTGVELQLELKVIGE